MMRAVLTAVLAVLFLASWQRIQNLNPKIQPSVNCNNMPPIMLLPFEVKSKGTAS